ncbi:helix-turn-helix transcriptional regulator [Streptomyces sp. JNUCC 64]
MISSSARLLRLVALLSTRPTWTCRELAERMAVTDRTVRRDIARLRDLGYGVESDPGPWGGYRLGGGTRVPPLVLDDEEALAVAVALREAALSGVLGDDRSALSALGKLRRVLPPRIADRLGEMDATFVHTPRSGGPQLPPGVLRELAAACRRGERARLAYRDHAGNETVRDVDPYRLVHTGRRWYFVARDVAKDQWRTFRADRVVRVRSTGAAVELGDPPDPALLVSRSIAGVVYPLYVTVRLPHPLDRALRIVPPTIGAHHPDGPHATVVEIGGNDVDQLVTYLLGLGTPLRVLSPDPVREELLRRLRELSEDNGGRDGAGRTGEPTEPDGSDGPGGVDERGKPDRPDGLDGPDGVGGPDERREPDRPDGSGGSDASGGPG